MEEAMHDADDGDSGSQPTERVVRSLLNGLVLVNGPRPSTEPGRDKFDRQWAKKLWKTIKEQDRSANREEVEEIADKALLLVVNLLTELRGPDRTALSLYEMACVMTTRSRLGRPRSKTHHPDHLAHLERMVLMRERVVGRKRAITEVLAAELREHRPALRNHLHRHLPLLRTKS